MTGSSETTHGDALARVAAEGGPNSAKLLGDLFERNEREAQWTADRIQAGLERERDEWRERAQCAERRLARIESKLWGLLS